MTDSLNITIAQVNFTVGDIYHNVQKIISIYKNITQTTNLIIPDLLVFSELSITGYPAEDLYLQSNFQNKSLDVMEKLRVITINNPCALLIGNLFPSENEKPINAAYLIKNGNIIHISSKNNLPSYGVFNDERCFSSALKNEIFTLNNYKIGCIICEDMWHQELPSNLYARDIDVLLVINASPFNLEKDKQRKAIAQEICLKSKVDLVYVNQVGAQDEIIFDGGSFVCDSNGEIKIQLEYFVEDSININWNNKKIITKKNLEILSFEENIYNALMLGIKDYINKSGFKKVILGLSGGIDSALSAAVAVDALGAENVVAVMLPSQYTSKLSIDDAFAFARQINIEILNLSIEDIAKITRLTLSESGSELKSGSLADQNIQARIRGLLLMALSNQYGYLLLSTGNKSENAVGYATIYGDMCGGYNIIKDVYKTQVYDLAKWRKLPKSIIDKAPSAELFIDQKDQDNLPEYEILDKILFGLIEEKLSISEISDRGYDFELVKKIFNLLKKSEYKRKQSCPGPIISTFSLSKDRRYPIVNNFDNF